MNDYKPLVGRRIFVFTDFLTFEGTLQRAGRDSLTLEHASAVADDGSRRPIDGEALIPALQVQWVQVP